MNFYKIVLTVVFLLHFSHACAYRILFAVNKFPKLTETFVLSQITGLLQRNYTIHIWAREKDETSLIHPDVLRFGLLKKVQYFDYSEPRNFLAMKKFINKFDIIYCQYDRFAFLLAELKRIKCFHGKLVVCIRGGDLKKRIIESEERYKKLFNHVDLFMPVCNYYKKILIKAGCQANKIVVHHSAINCKKFKPKLNHQENNGKLIYVLTTARLIESKGLQYSIEALSHLCKKYPDLRYTIIGGGAMKQVLQKKIDSLDLNRQIKLLGWLPHDKVLQFLFNSHIFLLSSVENEGIPNALMEAMACELPVIATKLNGIPELVSDGITGFVVTARNSEKIMQKIEYLLENREVWSKVGKAGRKFVLQEHNIDRENERLNNIFDLLMHDKRNLILKYESQSIKG